MGALSGDTLCQPDYRDLIRLLIGQADPHLASDWLLMSLSSPPLVTGVIVWTWGDIVPVYRRWLSDDSDDLRCRVSASDWLLSPTLVSDWSASGH